MNAEDKHAVQVIDLMAGDPVVVAADLPLSGVARVLADYDVRGLPVVDAEGRLVGVVSQTDIVRASASSGWRDRLVRDVMTSPAVTIRGSATLSEAARTMVARGVDRLVVVGEDATTAHGVISQSDVVRDLAR